MPGFLSKSLEVSTGPPLAPTALQSIITRTCFGRTGTTDPPLLSGEWLPWATRRPTMATGSEGRESPQLSLRFWLHGHWAKQACSFAVSRAIFCSRCRGRVSGVGKKWLLCLTRMMNSICWKDASPPSPEGESCIRVAGRGASPPP